MIKNEIKLTLHFYRLVIKKSRSRFWWIILLRFILLLHIGNFQLFWFGLLGVLNKTKSVWPKSSNIQKVISALRAAMQLGCIELKTLVNGTPPTCTKQTINKVKMILRNGGAGPWGDTNVVSARYVGQTVYWVICPALHVKNKGKRNDLAN